MFDEYSVSSDISSDCDMLGCWVYGGNTRLGLPFPFLLSELSPFIPRFGVSHTNQDPLVLPFLRMLVHPLLLIPSSSHGTSWFPGGLIRKDLTSESNVGLEF